jgi:type IV secretion system protein VirB10
MGGLLIVVFLAALWGLRKPPPQAASPADQTHDVDHVSIAEGLNALPSNYASITQPDKKQIPRLGAPIGELGRSVLQEEQAAGLQPLAERPTFAPNPEEDALRTKRLKDEQADEEAVKSAVFVPLKQHSMQQADHSASAPENGSGGAGLAQTDQVPSVRSASAPTAQEHKDAFLNVGDKGESQIYGTGTLQTPRSTAQIMAGTIIPAALMTGIDSDLPGEIEAQVTSPVYDTVSGQLLLIPQGARLIGQYDSQVTYGQSRVLLVWTRLIMPDGSSIVLDRLPGVDPMGRAGLSDSVDWHSGRLVAGAALSTLLGVAAGLAEPNQVAANGSSVVVIASKQGLQDSLNQVGQETTRRNLDVQPTLGIRPGFPVQVMVNKDLILRPYGIQQARPTASQYKTSNSEGQTE